jgi:hypothetical protein
MTKRQIQKIQCRVRRSVNGLYRSYLTSMLHGMRPYDRTGDVEQSLASVVPRTYAVRSTTTHCKMKLRADLSSACLRERLWQVQHLQLDLCATARP